MICHRIETVPEALPFGGEKQFRRVLERLLQRIGDDVGWFVHVPQPVCFINHHEVPVHGANICSFTACELVRADNDVLGMEGMAIALLDRGIIRLGFEDTARQEEFFLQFLVPLLTEVGRGDDQETAFALRPSLGEDKPCLNSLAQAHFIRENSAFGKRRLEREQCRFDLVWIQVDLRVYKRTRELLNTVRGAALGQLVGEIFCVVIRQVYHSIAKRMPYAVALQLYSEAAITAPIVHSTVDYATAVVNVPAFGLIAGVRGTAATRTARQYQAADSGSGSA